MNSLLELAMRAGAEAQGQAQARTIQKDQAERESKTKITMHAAEVPDATRERVIAFLREKGRI
jgi:hypothetical protein